MLSEATTRRAALRRHVHDAHEQLDALIGELETRGDYLRYLRGIAAFRIAAEQALRAVAYPDWFDGWRPVSTVSALQEDVRILGVEVPDMPAIAPPNGESALLGMLYTIEGSALGARLIARRAGALGLDSRNGAGHLAVQTGAPENWRVFLALLEKAPVFDEDEAGSAASALFRHAGNAVKMADRAEEELHG